MTAQMYPVVASGGKCFRTYVALVWFLFGVYATYVHRQMVPLGELFLTELTLKWFFARVDTHMLLLAARIGESFQTDMTLVAPVTWN